MDVLCAFVTAACFFSQCERVLTRLQARKVAAGLAALINSVMVLRIAAPQTRPVHCHTTPEGMNWQNSALVFR
jgi:hypothetical protein